MYFNRFTIHNMIVCFANSDLSDVVIFTLCPVVPYDGMDLSDGV